MSSSVKVPSIVTFTEATGLVQITSRCLISTMCIAAFWYSFVIFLYVDKNQLQRYCFFLT